MDFDSVLQYVAFPRIEFGKNADEGENETDELHRGRQDMIFLSSSGCGKRVSSKLFVSRLMTWRCPVIAKKLLKKPLLVLMSRPPLTENARISKSPHSIA